MFFSNEIPFLMSLSEKLSQGLQSLSPENKEKHRAYITNKQLASGAFTNRHNEEDLYYSSFALRSLQVTGAVPQQVLRGLSPYLQRQKDVAHSHIDKLNFLQMVLALQLHGTMPVELDLDEAWLKRFFEGLENCRTSDGGYAKAPEGAVGSTYHTFMILLTYELLGREIPDSSTLVTFIRNRQRDDGGFVEIAPMRRSGTNPTAAALVMLQRLNAIDEHDKEDITGFLTDVWSAEGGFAANSRIPFADSLSTFTALICLAILDTHSQFDLARIHQMVTEQLEFPTGGFRAAGWDNESDLEYTFYGLGCLALTTVLKSP